MKVLVMSDSHGSKNLISKIVADNLDAQVIIFLGDGEHDLENITFLNENAELIAVCGNCDIASQLPADYLRCIGGHTFYCTHGFVQRVKLGTTELLKNAEKYNADIVLYGHTHIPVKKYKNGIYLFNPGSVRDGLYGIININNSSVNFEHKLLEEQ